MNKLGWAEQTHSCEVLGTQKRNIGSKNKEKMMSDPARWFESMNNYILFRCTFIWYFALSLLDCQLLSSIEAAFHFMSCHVKIRWTIFSVCFDLRSSSFNNLLPKPIRMIDINSWLDLGQFIPNYHSDHWTQILSNYWDLRFYQRATEGETIFNVTLAYVDDKRSLMKHSMTNCTDKNIYQCFRHFYKNWVDGFVMMKPLKKQLHV